MEAVVAYESGRWLLSLDGTQHAYSDLEEAVEEARGILRSAGGGTISISPGPGTDRDTIRVSPAQPVSAPSAPAPPAPAPPRPSTAATASGSPAGGESRGVADIAALRTSFQHARGEIETFDDPIERNIGLATLRLEAAHTLNQLRTTGRDLSERDLEPLSTYVVALTGGETAEAAVAKVDGAAEEVLRDVGMSLAKMKLTGSIATIFGFVVLIFNRAAAVGSGAALAIMAGNSLAFYLALRLFVTYGPVAERAMNASYGWASSLGARSERALLPARQIQQRLWATYTGAPWRYRSLAAKAQTRAKLIIVFFWGAIVFVAVAFGIGFVGALIEVAESVSSINNMTTTPELTPTPEPSF